MTDEDEMPVEVDPATMLTLTDDHRFVRFDLPSMELDRLPEPLRIHTDFDAGAVARLIERLSELQIEMTLPPLGPHD